MKVGVKFCGGCNPYIDRKNVIERVKSMLPTGKFTFEYFDFDNCEIFLVINGCSLACAKFADKKNIIMVSGFAIDGKQYTEEDLPLAVFKRLVAIASGSG